MSKTALMLLAGVAVVGGGYYFLVMRRPQRRSPPSASASTATVKTPNSNEKTQYNPADWATPNSSGENRSQTRETLADLGQNLLGTGLQWAQRQDFGTI